VQNWEGVLLIHRLPSPGQEATGVDREGLRAPLAQPYAAARAYDAPNEVAPMKAPPSLAQRVADHVHPLRWFFGALPDPAPVPDLAWRLATQAEAEEWVRTRGPSAADREMYRLALESRHALMLAEDAGRIVGHRWLGGGWAYLPGPVWCRARFPTRVAYCYDLHIERSHRGRGLSRGGVRGALGVARELGYDAFAVYVVRANTPNVRNWMHVAVHWFDVTRVTLRRKGLWLPRPPWSRVGVEQVEAWAP